MAPGLAAEGSGRGWLHPDVLPGEALSVRETPCEAEGGNLRLNDNALASTSLPDPESMGSIRVTEKLILYGTGIAIT